MKNDLTPEKVNALEAALGLREKTALERFTEKPCEATLREIPKRIQTPEIVRLAVEHDGMAIKYISRPLDEIIADYRSRISIRALDCQSLMLQNEVLVKYKNRKSAIISEKQLMESSDDDLRELLSKSTFILLGGIGFSGLNKLYNAKMGLYRSAVPTIEDDMALSDRFRKVYEKLNRCAGDMQVIVLTHTPVYDWTSEPCNPNWIYINGHTHQNSLVRRTDGTTILSDNQIGYKPRKWKLNAFTIAGWYDPFSIMKDGIHEITSEMYRDFNFGRGIQSNGCKYDGIIYALKRNGYYMFILCSKYSLCLLVGGQRKKLANSHVEYYYDRMEQYVLKVKEALKPYQDAIRAIANEIKLIGGAGTVHGCIVDIDWFNHIYLNPFDGKVTPYFAYNISSRRIYPDLPSLLKATLPDINRNYLAAQKKKMIPFLTQYAVSMKKKADQMPLATVPQIVLGTEMYDPSRLMRSLQYIFDDNIIRVWNDDVLKADFDTNSSILTIEDKKNNNSVEE